MYKDVELELFWHTENNINGGYTEKATITKNTLQNVFKIFENSDLPAKARIVPRRDYFSEKGGRYYQVRIISTRCLHMQSK